MFEVSLDYMMVFLKEGRKEEREGRTEGWMERGREGGKK